MFFTLISPQRPARFHHCGQNHHLVIWSSSSSNCEGVICSSSNHCEKNEEKNIAVKYCFFGWNHGTTVWMYETPVNHGINYLSTSTGDRRISAINRVHQNQTPGPEASSSADFLRFNKSWLFFQRLVGWIKVASNVASGIKVGNNLRNNSYWIFTPPKSNMDTLKNDGFPIRISFYRGQCSEAKCCFFAGI